MTNPGMGERGFTLAELMIVVVILGILASVSYPTYHNMVGNAMASNCRQNQKRVYDAGILYHAEEGIELDYTGTINSKILVQGGCLDEEIAGCPASDTDDYDDYDIEFDSGEIVDITCLIEDDLHGWAPPGH